MATGVRSPSRAAIPERTLRRDRWWVSPLWMAFVLTAFSVYATWRAFTGEDYYVTPYLSPFYSPCLSTACPPAASAFGQPIDWFPFSPALLILVFPLALRLTCYYYRKMYYRSFWLSPPACSVAEPHNRYTGETRFPLILQNAHRWSFYIAALYPPILLYEAIMAFRDENYEWGFMGLGTVILLVNALLLGLYTFSCHSCRHVIGGRLRNFSANPIRYRLWTMVSRINGNHGLWAQVSLFSVALADLYVFLLSRGVLTDIRFF